MEPDESTLDAWLRQRRPPPPPEVMLRVWLRRLVDRNPVGTRQPCRQRSAPVAEKAERSAYPGGFRLPAPQVLDERLKIASDMLLLSLRDAAGLPTGQQEALREAVTRLQAVQAWVKLHANGRA